MTNKPDHAHVVAELEKHPAALLSAYQESIDAVQTIVGGPAALKFAEEGVMLANIGPRAWEAATEYFKAAPAVANTIGFSQFERWVESGKDLVEESPVVAAAYFRSSPQVLPTLAPRHIAGWASLGKSLSRGTWKSSSLSARFFDVSSDLVRNVSFHELQLFVGLVQTLSNRSYDLASEALVLGQRVLPAITEREELISLASVLAETSWREVRGSFEASSRVSLSVDRKLRRRYFTLTERLARMGMPNVSTFMLESAQSLARLPQDEQETVLDRAEDLADTSAEAVGAFLRTAPTVLERISTHQIEDWYEKGVEFLKENPDGGIAYFKLESQRAEQLLDSLSSSIEFERVRGTLGLYANALAGSEVQLQSIQDLTHKNIGWVSMEMATTDGRNVFLPAVVDQHDSKDGNFAWLKVVATHQVGHIEFKSFNFNFNREGDGFETLRKEVAKEIGAEPSNTDVSSFFDMFPVRNLAADVFSVVEDARVDANLLERYRGLKKHYLEVQNETLEHRTPIQSMPAQQAMVELLIRLSLHQTENATVPSAYVRQARELAALLKKVQDPTATVEDSAEATLRIYHLISQMTNEQVAPDDWEEIDLSETEFTEPDIQQVIQNLRDQMEHAEDEEQAGEDYESPEDVEYRGDFKPEMVQLLAKMRGQQTGDEEGAEQMAQSLTQEEIEELLRDSSEVDFDDDADVETVAANMMKEAGAESQNNPQGRGYSQIPHQDEEGGPLEPTEPRSYVYDEWDFRANDYRPRWCVVQERTGTAGESDFYSETLHQYASLMDQIRRQFESIRPETYRKHKRLPEGEDVDFDAAIEALIDLRSKISPDDRIYWRRNKDERDVAVAFLIDMSASTAEAVEEGTRDGEWNAPGDPVAYTAWLRARRGETNRRPYKRIIDVEKESMVLLMNALEVIGDRYGVYGFSGFGRENVEFYVIKDVEEQLSDKVKKRIDKVAPLHATRMGPAIRHTAAKLAKIDAKSKFMFVISDGRPQDRGYSREGVEKEYAVQDTRMALMEARQLNITPFCLTVDRNGHDYLRTMAGDLSYEVLPDILELPRRLPQLYKSITL